MRQIKFRAWDSRDKKWFDKFELHSDTGKLVGINHAYGNIHVMQFTGLFDKTGKEIYEGDIIRFNALTGFTVHYEVRWKGKGYKPTRMSEHNQDEMTVIGNIYENPELLKS